MKLTYIIFLAFKNLRGHKLRTFLTAGGVAISVGFVVFLVSLGLGLQRVSTEQIANLNALRVIDVSSSKSKILTIDDTTLEKFSTLSNVNEVQPMTSLPSSIIFKSSKVDAVVYGKNIEYLQHEELKMLSGTKYSKNNLNEVMISSGLLEQLASNEVLGSEINISLIVRPELLGKDEKTKKEELKVKVIGVIDDKNAPYLYISNDIIKNLDIPNYSGAKVILNSKDDVEIAKLQIENLGFRVSSIKDTVDQINQFFSLFQIILVSFGAIAIIVACLGMFNTLTITLLEKTREVGFMKALGTRKKDVYRLFIFESLLIGILGSIVGIIIGSGLGYFINLSISSLANATGNKSVILFYTPIYLIFFAIITAILISFLTGLYPSRRAAKINPLDALRYE